MKTKILTWNLGLLKNWNQKENNKSVANLENGLLSDIREVF